MDGILLIDKPSGPTSFEVVRAARKKTNQRKVGHAGTLDPLASGLLVVCLGQGTKLVPFLMDGDKRYHAEVRLGAATDTLDADGEVTETKPIPPLDGKIAQAVFAKFIGTIEQLPPKYSAIKQGGQPLHRRMRRGEEVTVEPRQVRIDAIELLRMDKDMLELDVRCHKGTYIRSLARDIAEALGTVGHLAVLRREASSGFTVKDAIPYERLTLEESDVTDDLIPLAEGLPCTPRWILTEAEETDIRYGRSIQIAPERIATHPGTLAPWRLLNKDGGLVALAKRTDDFLSPFRVFP